MVKLIVFNLILAVLHFAQFIAQLIISQLPEYKNISIGITRTYISRGASWSNNVTVGVLTVGHINPMLAISSFLCITGIFHVIMAIYLSMRGKDNSDTSKVASRLFRGYHIRWIEYSITSTIMVCVLFLMLGVTDLYANILAIGCNVAMIWFGINSDDYRYIRNIETKGMAWLPFGFGTIIGLFPWLVIFLQLGLSKVGDIQEIGAIVIAMTVVTFVGYFSFALIALYGLVYITSPMEGDTMHECCYAVASLVTKSFLAWIIFAAFVAS
jgi:hypothetical protein